MSDLKIEGTKNTPIVDFSGDGNMIIEGRAFAEDPRSFFEPILAWCQSVALSKVNLKVKLEYLNTLSTKFMKDVIRTLDANSQVATKEISWYYEEDDEDMLEVGQFIEESTLSTRFYYLDSL